MAKQQRPPRLAIAKPRHITTVVRDPELVIRRHEQIFKAAIHVFISRGFHQATVREIAEQAGLSLGSLYSYIKSKEDILYLVFQKLTTVLREDIRQAIVGIEDPAQQIAAAVRANLETIERYQDEILVLYQETKSLERESLYSVLSSEAAYVRFFEEILQAGYQRGIFKGDPRLSADVITYLCAILALRRWNLRRRFSSKEVQKGLLAFIMRGLGVTETRGA